MDPCVYTVPHSLKNSSVSHVHGLICGALTKHPSMMSSDHIESLIGYCQKEDAPLMAQVSKELFDWILEVIKRDMQPYFYGERQNLDGYALFLCLFFCKWSYHCFCGIFYGVFCVQ